MEEHSPRGYGSEEPNNSSRERSNPSEELGVEAFEDADDPFQEEGSSFNQESNADNDLGSVNLFVLGEYLTSQLEKCAKRRKVIKTLLESVNTEEAILKNNLEAWNKVGNHVTHHGEDLGSVTQQTNPNLARDMKQLIDVFYNARDPLGFLYQQEGATYLKRLVSQHLSLVDGRFERVESGCIEQFFPSAEVVTHSNSVDVFGIIWAMRMESTLRNGIITLEPFLACSGFSQMRTGNRNAIQNQGIQNMNELFMRGFRDTFNVTAEVRGMIELVIDTADSTEPTTRREYFQFLGNERFEYKKTQSIKKLPEFQFNESELGPIDPEAPIDQCCVRCFLFVSEPKYSGDRHQIPIRRHY